MPTRALTTAWTSVFMALFLVMVLPACWYGAMTRSWVMNTQAPSSTNQNEERDEHEQRDDHQVQGLGTPPPPPPSRSLSPAPSTTVYVVATPVARPFSAAVAPHFHPSQLSVRRLI